jgi:hypothetical protein
VSTAFINGLSIAWKAGVPFFVVLVVTFAVVARRRGARPVPAERDGGARAADEPSPRDCRTL